MPRPKDSIGQLLNPCTSVREQMRRRGIRPKNYAAAYRKQLRQLEARNKQVAILQTQMEVQAKKSFTQPVKFQHITPRAFSAASKEADKWTKKHSFLARRSPRVPPVSSCFDDENSTTPSHASIQHNFARTATGVHTPYKPSLPREAVQPVATPRPTPNKNFIRANIRAADRMTPPPKAQVTRRHANFGKVPQYLLKRNAELALLKIKEEKELQRQASDTPEGMKLLPEKKRLEMLKVLVDTKNEVMEALSAMPLAIATYGQGKRMAAIEHKCQQLEASIRLFSRRKVYVKNTPDDGDDNNSSDDELQKNIFNDYEANRI